VSSAPIAVALAVALALAGPAGAPATGLRRLDTYQATRNVAASADTRAVARQILAEGRFREHPLPRPLERPLAWLSDRLRPIGRALSDALQAVARLAPGGSATGLAVLGAAVFGSRWWLRVLWRAGGSA